MSDWDNPSLGMTKLEKVYDIDKDGAEAYENLSPEQRYRLKNTKPQSMLNRFKRWIKRKEST